MKQDLKLKKAILWIKESKTKSPCPDEESLAAFVEQKLPESEYGVLCAHLLACETCRDMATVALGETPAGVRVPVEVMRRVIELFPAEKSAWEVVVRFASDFVEVLKNSGARTQYFAPAAAGARSGSVSKANLVACSRNVSGIDTELEIERLDGEMGELKVNFREGGGIPSPPVRVTLKKDGKELASYLAAKGAAVFERVPLGMYNISISRKGVSLGEIALEMKGE